MKLRNSIAVLNFFSVLLTKADRYFHVYNKKINVLLKYITLYLGLGVTRKYESAIIYKKLFCKVFINLTHMDPNV